MKTQNSVRSGLFAAFFAIIAIVCLGLTARAETPPASSASNGDIGGAEGNAGQLFAERRAAAKASVVETPHAKARTFVAVLPNTSHPTYLGVAGQVRDWLMSGAPAGTKPSVVTDKLSISGILAAGNSDFGSRTHFPLLVESHRKFTLSGVGWVMTSSDGANSLGYTSGLNGLSFDPVTRVGIDYGADNMVGGTGSNADTTRIADGGSVNKLAYIGAGNSYRANDQADINGATTYYNSQRPFTLTCAYRVQFEGGGVLDITQTASSFGVSTLTSSREGSNVRLQLGVTGDVTGANFAIQSSTDLVNWVNTGTSLAPGGTTTVPANGSLFFRAYRP